MVLKLYGSALSTACALVVILEKELPYELIVVDISKGEQKSEDYMKLQPFGKVSVLDDDGFILFESRAISKYLARQVIVMKYTSGSKLIPDEGDHQAYALFEQACSMERSYFSSAAETIGIETVVKKLKGLGPPDEARVAEAEAGINTVFAVYDKILAKQKYLAGNELTLVDLFHLPSGSALKKSGYEETFEKYPNVDKWFKGLQERETWPKASALATSPSYISNPDIAHSA
ncbi:Glutathione S-transferase hmp2 [Arthroderma sp. PD_2]|nr:Glutathione S-transferase hmp2 [Arthroderma sp. PD_2]